MWPWKPKEVLPPEQAAREKKIRSEAHWRGFWNGLLFVFLCYCIKSWDEGRVAALETTRRAEEEIAKKHGAAPPVTAKP